MVIILLNFITTAPVLEIERIFAISGVGSVEFTVLFFL